MVGRDDACWRDEVYGYVGELEWMNECGNDSGIDTIHAVVLCCHCHVHYPFIYFN